MHKSVHNSIYDLRMCTGPRRATAHLVGLDIRSLPTEDFPYPVLRRLGSRSTPDGLMPHDLYGQAPRLPGSAIRPLNWCIARTGPGECQPGRRVRGPMVARLDRGRVANGNCAVVFRTSGSTPSERATACGQMAGRRPRGPTRNGGHAGSVLTAVGVPPAGGSADQCRASAARLDHRRSARAVPWLENLVIGSCEALCASGRKAYYHRYCSGPRQLHSHGVAHVAVGSGFFNAFIHLRRK